MNNSTLASHSASKEKTADLYLDLLKKCLTNTIYEDPGIPRGKYKGEYSPDNRENGKDWPQKAHTMVGLKRLDNLQFCMESVRKNNVPGDFIETGVWRGGSTIFMRGFLKAYNDSNRKVWVADSFQGLPRPKNPKTDIDISHYKELAIPLEEVKSNYTKYDLLDDQVVFLKGWFSETLPKAPIEKLAVLRLDGDMYESTMDALNSLYPKLSIGGYVIVDDYAIDVCAKAIHDYRKAHGITDPIERCDWTCVYWQKTK